MYNRTRESVSSTATSVHHLRQFSDYSRSAFAPRLPRLGIRQVQFKLAVGASSRKALGCHCLNDDRRSPVADRPSTRGKPWGQDNKARPGRIGHRVIDQTGDGSDRRVGAPRNVAKRLSSNQGDVLHQADAVLGR